MLPIPLRVDVQGAIEIAGAALSFEWAWTRADVERFARTVGWAPPDSRGAADAPSTRTSLSIWAPDAVFWHHAGDLCQIHIAVSDAPAGDPADSERLRTSAAGAAVTALTSLLGDPVDGHIGTAEGSVWERGEVSIGISAADRVELVLVNPAWQRFWTQRRRATAAGIDSLHLSDDRTRPHPGRPSPENDFNRTRFEPNSDRRWKSYVDLDLSGALAITHTASAFDWTWTRVDVERFAAHAGWELEDDAAHGDMIYAATGFEVNDPKAIFWLDGEALTSLDIMISDDFSDIDLEDEGYAHLVTALELAMCAALTGFRDELGDPLHGSLGSGSDLCWEFPGFVAGPNHNYDSILLQISGPAEREQGLADSAERVVSRVRAAIWEQLTADFAVVVAAVHAGGSGVRIEAGGGRFATVTGGPEGLELTLGATPTATRWRFSESTRNHLVEDRGWTAPNRARPNWHRRLDAPALFRDYLDLARSAIWALRTAGEDCSPATLRLHTSAADPGAAWPWT
ncbi:DUF6301 family protein [Nocardia sp. NPDC055321]